MQRRFTTLDVFTGKRYSGNPLAVVHDAEGLDSDAMHAVAREFNLSETVFVLRPADRSHKARLRIFTVGGELPFAGHPTVGTAVLLGLDLGSPQSFVLEEKIGPIRCVVDPAGKDRGRATFDLPRLPERIGDTGEASAVAASLGLTLDDLGCDEFEPGRWSAGVEFSMIPVRGLDAIGRARCDLGRWEKAFGAAGPRTVYLYCRETTEPGHAFHARMFAPLLGIPEDPATGSAAAAFAGVIAHYGDLAGGKHTFAIEQGYEMGRPSVIHLTMTQSQGIVTAAAIGGDAVVVSTGVIEA
jgi:trans-2,3-dihydro-3-hydroxyanthranilate isomerase